METGSHMTAHTTIQHRAIIQNDVASWFSRPLGRWLTAQPYPGTQLIPEYNVI
jgi:hypothetical protein